MNSKECFLLFGGQGYPYLNELQFCLGYDQSSLARQLLELGNLALIDEEVRIHQESIHLGRYPFSSGWLVSPNDVAQPPNSHLSASPCSYPLIFLTQMCNYACALDQMKATHETFLPCVKAGSGHSQGVVASFVISISPTTEALKMNVLKYLRCMFWLGARVHVKSEVSPMLAVSGLSPEALTTELEKTLIELAILNDLTAKAGGKGAKRAQEESLELIPSLHLSLINGTKNCVVSGRSRALNALKENLEKLSAPIGSQSRVPFSKRRPEISMIFLNVSSPFHSKLNAPHSSQVLADWSRILSTQDDVELAFPVLSTLDASPFPFAKEIDFTQLLVDMQLTEQLNFPLLARAIPSYSKVVLEFGPGSGAAKLLLAEQLGSGIVVATCRSNALLKDISDDTEELMSLSQFLKNNVCQGPNWAEEFRPRLVFSKSYGKLIVDTKFTRLLGKPPIMMAGMTPTTGFYGLNLVSACTNAGYHGELAGGGIPLPDYFKEKIAELVQKNSSGAGITVNMLYLNAYLWGFQFPLFCELAKMGYPLESVTIAAGVPTGEKAEEILQQLSQVGSKYLSLKPGSVQAILDCLEISLVAEKYNIALVVQWTGGRGGGHHSFEDFHKPLLDTYGRIRKRKNVVLVVGSGFGDALHSLPYLNGTWSTQFGKPLMPCDGVLMGSRCMVALEANTSAKVKELIVNTPGVELQADWESSYDTHAGGVVTVTSELGEPIHKINNRGMRCWKEFDAKYFSVERGPKRAATIAKDKQHIISRLNADFQKVYFGLKYDTGIPCDLENMTYWEVLQRMVELMFVSKRKRWIDVTYQTRTFSFMIRTERRFRRTGVVVTDSVTKLREDPLLFLNEFSLIYPEIKSTLLADDDVSYFIDLCKDLRNGKPVNFIPIVDGDLDFWFKKDSLWCSEDLEAIQDEDSERVCILQGPVAVKYSTKVNEPIRDILESVHQGWVDFLPQEKIEVVESFSTLNEGAQKLLEIEYPFLLNTDLHSWQRVVLSSDVKICMPEKRLGPNVIPRLFKVALKEKLDVIVSPNSITCAFLELIREGETILLRVLHKDSWAEVSYLFQPFFSRAPLLQLKMETRSVFSRVWLLETERNQLFSVHDVHESKFQVTESMVRDFNRAIKRIDINTDLPLSNPSLDFAIVCGWRPLIKTLFAKEMTGELLNLVHLSHAYRFLNETEFSSRQLHVNELISSSVRISSIEILPGIGKKIVCKGILSRHPQGEKWVEIISSFLIRGEFTDFNKQFISSPIEPEFVLDIKSNADCALLRAKTWFTSSELILPGMQLVFVITSLFEQRCSKEEFQGVHVEANVFLLANRNNLIGKVFFDSHEILSENPVLAFLRRSRISIERGKLLENGGVTLLTEPKVFKVPVDPKLFDYGRASGDLNPIHSSDFFACLAGLSGPIVHGMWTCALARQVVEEFACENDATLIYKFDVEFLGMVYFGEQVACQLTLLGIVSGRKLVSIEMRDMRTNTPVLKGRAHIEQVKTAYLFTGQGSASVNMGMDRYEEVASVRKVWDVADRHLRAKFGFSILEIVRTNPKKLTIHFGGPTGRILRENFRNIRVSKDNQLVQLLPEISPDTKSFTFHGPEGLLFATQFAQPALVIIQKAAFQELVDGGFVPVDSSFAGHSLGEYAGLASFAEVLSIEDLVETVFLRGMVMQNAVPRDSKGNSEFGMVAVNPSRVKNIVTPEQLVELVEQISKDSEVLLQVVNFNVKGTQYVVAGHLLALDCLSFCLSTGESVNVGLARTRERMRIAKEGNVTFALERGIATVPLAGIDVPFHSRQLLGGVPAFRELLEPRLSVERVSRMLDQLIGKYIPNVTARFFSLEVEYIEYAAQVMGSSRLEVLVTKIKSGVKISDAEVARILLIELLAHQFAMPVLWIDTQELIFNDNTRRVIEMGPAPTLVSMAKRTFETSIHSKEFKAEILWWGRDMSTIVFAGLEDKGPSLDSYISLFNSRQEGVEEEDIETPRPPPRAPPTTSSRTFAVETASHTVFPFSGKHVLKVLLASKFKKRYDDIKDDSSIKGLSQGKSAMQNELVGDLAQEFNLDTSNAADMTIHEFGNKLALYKQLGKVSSVLISRTLGSKLPGNFPASTARSYLQAKGISNEGVDSVLLHGCGLIPPTSRLTDPESAKNWLDQCVDLFTKDLGVAYKASVLSSVSQVVEGDNHYEQEAPLPDRLPTAKHVLQVLISSKLKIPLKDVKSEMSIKQLSQGKSAVQNEVVGDLASEFVGGGQVDNIAESSLNELGDKLGQNFKQLGKASQTLVSKTMAAKLPGSFTTSAARDYLKNKWGFGPMMTDSVMLHACVIDVPVSRLTTLEAAQTWLDSAANSFASYAGISLQKGVRASLGKSHNIVENSAALNQHTKRLEALLRSQVDALEGFLGKRVSRDPIVVQDSDLKQLDEIKQELGEKFLDGIRSVHTPLKVREYDSFWNWVIQDALELHLHVLGTLKWMKGDQSAPIPHAHNPHFKAMAEWIKAVSNGSTEHVPPQAWFRNFLCNRATKELLIAVEYFATDMNIKGEVEYAQIISLLAEEVEAWVKRPPVLVARASHLKPCTWVSAEGKLIFDEVPRENVGSDCVKYVEELSCGTYYSCDVNVAFDTKQVPFPSHHLILGSVDVPFLLTEDDEESHTNQKKKTIEQSEEKSDQHRLKRPSGPLLDTMRSTVIRHGTSSTAQSSGSMPLVYIKSCPPQNSSVRIFDEVKSAQYLACLHNLSSNGVSFAGQVVLFTGAGMGSIAIEMVKMLLEGGAIVISAINYAKSEESIQNTLSFYRRIYEEHGSKGSRLITQPCNAGSVQDVLALVEHIYTSLLLDIDFIVPFAALPERGGKDISNLDAEAELAHRAMLTNVLRLLGSVKDAKAKREITTRPATVLLPFSPNHGVFGNDGLYAESKLGLESLMDKWRSEGWQDFLSFVGCVIGWTRSALMHQNNLVASGVEQEGVRTFSTSEMAVNLVALMHPQMVNLACEEPLWADLTGGWQKIPNLDQKVKQIRQSLQEEASVKQAIFRDTSASVKRILLEKALTGLDQEWMEKSSAPLPNVPLSNHKSDFPPLPEYEALNKLNLTQSVDLHKVVCIVGFGEIGPWGNSRTRWEMEGYGEFSMEGCVELAWLVGLIIHWDGPLPNNPRLKHIGWIDAQTKEPVYDHEVKRKYEETILNHCGVRVLEPDLFEGYNPREKKVWTKVGVDVDLPFVEVQSKEMALEIQKACGGNCEILQDGASFRIRVKSGSVIAIPRSFNFNRFVVGQIPTGWNAERLGIPHEICKAVDPVTLFALISTMDAFVSCGVCDPYELYKYVHVSQVGNTSGGGMGGMRSLKRMFTDRTLDDPEVPSDTLSESFINTMPAWVNMLLLSSSGPIKTPVGACATAAESLEIGMETILSGKARVVVCGGYDDFGEVGSYEFGQMGATQDNEKDAAKGRKPSEASRPMTSSRSGFVEAHGAGIQIIMDCALAVEMGCPIYGIVGLTNTATDREGRSIPAPGRGILTTAREEVRFEGTVRKKNKCLDVQYRRKQIAKEMAFVQAWQTEEEATAFSLEERNLIAALANKKRAGVFETWGQGFYRNLSHDISPLTGALAVFGLSVDDIGVVSCHGTSTLLNDKNESGVVNLQMEHLGRKPGNICLVVSQKWLTAHPKGAAAAWMVNGACQMLTSGLVPGNRNLDNCANELQKFPFLFYPNRSIQLSKIEAILLKSFGFGQAGAEILLIHPNRVLASLTVLELEAYKLKRQERECRTFRFSQGVLSGKHKLFQAKTRAPYLPDQESAVYLNPSARASFDSELKTWTFQRSSDQTMMQTMMTSLSPPSSTTVSIPTAQQTTSRIPPPLISAETRLKVTLQEQAEGLSSFTSNGKGIGIDVEPISTFQCPKEKMDFISRNFTAKEILHCESTSDPSASFAGKWAAKEAVIKAMSSSQPENDARSLWSGGHAPLLLIEVLNSTSGAPVVILHGHALEVAQALGISVVKVSISHTGEVAVAQAIAT